MTRQDYMDGKVTYQQYYETLASEAGVSFKNSAALEKVCQALADGDEHLNSIPLPFWDSLAIASRRATSPVFKKHGDFWTLAGGVCLHKAAARRDARGGDNMKTIAASAKQKTIKVPYAGGFGVREVTLPGPFETIAQVHKANSDAGFHYFDRETLRFFRSRPSRTVIQGRFFIDSIQFVGSDGVAASREYRIVCVTDDGETNGFIRPPIGWNGEIRETEEQTNGRLGVQGLFLESRWGPERWESAQEARKALREFLKRAPEVVNHATV